MVDDCELQGPRFVLDRASLEYPAILRDSPNPPRRLFGIGNVGALQPGIAVIGSRKASPYGLSCAEIFARRIAQRGITIVSGGALGCDQRAHRAALEGGAQTVVVFGSAPDVTYPKRGKRLFQDIIDAGGVVISEQSWGTQPLPGMFVQRNRIIAGLSALVLIVEAGLPSGTFSTADAALRANRDVAAVPGSISSPNSRGTNQLITQGAYCVTDEASLDSAIELAWANCMYAMLPPGVESQARDSSDALVRHDAMLGALAAEPISAQELAAYFNFTVGEISACLAQYELQGIIQRGRDGRYQLCPRA